jgi:hypothetical protein
LRGDPIASILHHANHEASGVTDRLRALLLRLRPLLLLVSVLLFAKLAVEGYRWINYRSERTGLAAMRMRALDLGVEVVRSQARVDTLRRTIDRDDEDLEQKREAVDRYGRYSRGGSLSPERYAAYRRELKAYNEMVEMRNRKFRRWRELRARSTLALESYTRLADSMRALAGRIGDPYYPVPLPIEAAAERGLVPADP